MDVQSDLKEFGYHTGSTGKGSDRRIIFAVILPPVGVFMQVGIGKHFWLNILLTLLGYVPGIFHAIYIIVKK